LGSFQPGVSAATSAVLDDARRVTHE
jgi:hypothetical protein